MQPSLSRRRFLALGAAGAGAVALGACGSDDEPSASSTTKAASSSAGGGLVLSRFFGEGVLVAGIANRAPIGVADRDGLLSTDAAPQQLSVQLFDAEDNEVGEAVTVTRRSEGLPRPYYALPVTVDAPGYYVARAEIDGAVAETTIPVSAAAEVKVIQPGADLPPTPTPTTADSLGVTPICTLEPEMCALHDVSLPAALAERRPIALLISTPKFCQVAICGPVLDVMLGQVTDFPEVRFLHAEVYKDPERTLDESTEIVGSLGLFFEPALVLAGADGKVVGRLDNIYDASELSEALDQLTAVR
jgi:hypothetical protein